MNTNLAFCLGIGIPVLLILLVIIICYFIKKRLKAKISSTANDSADQKQIQMDNIQKKLPYNRIQNTSGLNNMALTPNNLSEIKVHNLGQFTDELEASEFIKSLLYFNVNYTIQTKL